VSPVIGVVLMITLTLVLASTLAASLATFDADLQGKQDQFEERLGPQTVSTNPWEGEQGDLLRPANNAAGATGVAYRVNFTVEPGSNTIGNSLNSIELRMQNTSLDMFSNVTQSDVDLVAVDNDSDGDIDEVITSDVDGIDVSNGGSTVKIELSGSAYTPQADDSIVAEFDGVDNPVAPGDYDLEAQTSGDGNWHNGTVTIV